MLTSIRVAMRLERRRVRGSEVSRSLADRGPPPSVGMIVAVLEAQSGRSPSFVSLTAARPVAF